VSYVVFGTTSTNPIRLTSMDYSGIASNGFAIAGASALDELGFSVSGAGDINGDGLADLIVGAPFADPYARSSGGKSYVIYGKADTTLVDLTNLQGSNGGSLGFVINGACGSDFAGGSVSSVGDVNGDGLADLVVSALGATATGAGSGKTYVIFGKPIVTRLIFPH